MRRQRLLHALGVTLIATAVTAAPASAQSAVKLAIVA